MCIRDRFHCPRLSELPDLDLYMDQVVTFLEQSLSVFSEGEKPITATMINNYVKQRVVTPPVRKRYAREHVAYLMVVFLLKKVLSIPEIIQLISMQSHAYDTELAYDYFCEELELSLIHICTAKVRLVDCVGYMVEGAMGHMENDAVRMVRTPWLDYDIPFEEAAEIGTRKVITEHSTIGIVMTTDGSITEIPRENYLPMEERVVKELQELGKPFVVVLNTKAPRAAETQTLCRELTDQYGVPVMPYDVLNMDEGEIEDLLKSVLYEFPLREVHLDIPDWILALSGDHWLMESIIQNVQEGCKDVHKVSDYRMVLEKLAENEFMEEVRRGQIDLGTGRAVIKAAPRQELFYQIIGDECGYPIEGEYHLVSILKELVAAKKEYDRVKDALDSVRATGYGMVKPTMDELDLEAPEIVRQGAAGRPPRCSGSGRPLPGPGRKRTRQTPAGRPAR